MIALSGLSGAGKSTAAKALEDLGYFVVDNLPAELLLKLVDLSEHGHHKRPLAVVIDSREAEHLSQFVRDWNSLSKRGVKTSLWFLDATDSTLIRRFQETRRPHPLDVTGQGLALSIQQERSLLAEISAAADQVIHTDSYNSHQLKAEIANLVGAHRDDSMTVRLMSFGFKHGLPTELDLCFDVRFLQNPYFIDTLKPKSGLDKPVAEFVLSDPRAQEFIRKTGELLEFLIPCYQAENKAYLTVAIGCTGGRHRSVALVGEIAQWLERFGCKPHITHRDIEK